MDDVSDFALSLPPEPEEPLDSDCCGNGCIPCVFDIYQEELELWKEECFRIKNGGASKSVLNYEESNDSLKFLGLEKVKYTGFTIVSIEHETYDAIRVRFFLPSTKSLGLSVGQHVILRASTSSGGLVTRQYTPISPIDCKGHFEILFKIYPTGKMSANMKTWKVGDEIQMRGPMAGLTYSPNKYRKVLMLSAGTGIAPMSQVINTILQNEEDETMIRLMYACKNYAEILAKSELSEWRRYWNFSVVYILSQEPEDGTSVYKYGDVIIRGHVDEKLVKMELGDFLDSTLVLICGTRSFDSDMLAFLSNLGISQNNIHKF